MIDFFKRLKLTYSIYNFFHKKQLQHNVGVYRKYGIKKSYFSPISSKDFRNVKVSEDLPVPLSERLARIPAFNQLDAHSQISLLNFENEGYSIINQFFTSSIVDQINEEVEILFKDEKIKFRYKNKLMFAYHHSRLLEGAGEDGRLKEILGALLNKKPILFQSINFLTGSEQKTHSDSIHMSTFPLGGLAAVWIALEDIALDNGPLHYYPKSHKLPYYLNSDYGNEGSSWLIGDKLYTEYEKMIEGKIRELPLDKKVFLAKKGDILIWHANLLHGGEPHLNKNKTRKSMVLHYFSEGSICYHEITQRPALIKSKA